MVTCKTFPLGIRPGHARPIGETTLNLMWTSTCSCRLHYSTTETQQRKDLPLSQSHDKVGYAYMALKHTSMSPDMSINIQSFANDGPLVASVAKPKTHQRVEDNEKTTTRRQLGIEKRTSPPKKESGIYPETKGYKSTHMRVDGTPYMSTSFFPFRRIINPSFFIGSVS